MHKIFSSNTDKTVIPTSYVHTSVYLSFYSGAEITFPLLIGRGGRKGMVLLFIYFLVFISILIYKQYIKLFFSQIKSVFLVMVTGKQYPCLYLNLFSPVLQSEWLHGSLALIKG